MRSNAVLVLALLFAVSRGASAQRYAMDRGVWQLSGSASLTHFHQDSDPRDGTSDFRFNPRVGYFVAPGFAITGNLSLSRQSANGATNTSYGAGPGVAYYFKRRPAPIHPFIAASVLYTRDRGSYQSTVQGAHYFTWEGTGGLAALLARNVAVTGELFYTHQAESFSSSQYQVKTGTADYGARFGIAIFLY